MHDPQLMVLIALISLIIFMAGVFMYKFVYPKKNIHPLILLLGISLLPLISILRPGSYESGDLSAHAKIAIMFYNMISHGNMIPQWSDLVCGGYGCPYFIFMYISPYYIASLFHSFGFSFVDSIKLVLATSFVGSGMAMYFWAKEEFGKKAGFIAGLFYLFAPYHLVDLHFRNAVGEMLAITALPLCFLFTKKIIMDAKPLWIILNAISISFLIFSHLVASVITIPFLVIYSLLILLHKKKNKFRSFASVLLSFFLSLSLSSFYWIPIAFEKQYIFWGSVTFVFFSPLSDLLYSPWRLGFLFQGHSGEASHAVGYFQLLAVVVALWFLVKKKITNRYKKNILILFLLSFLLTFLMILPMAKPLWDIIPLMKSFQFSYRLLIFNIFSTSIIAGIVLEEIPHKKFVIIFCFLAFATTILNWGNRKVAPEITDQSIKNQLLYTDFAQRDFVSPIWINGNPTYNKHRPLGDQLIVTSGQAQIKQIKSDPLKHEYLILAQSDISLRDNTFYYPGWIVTANENPTPIILKDKQYPGTIMFTLKKGLYKVDVQFTDTLARKIGKYITLLTVIAILLYTFIALLPKKFYKKIMSLQYK